MRQLVSSGAPWESIGGYSRAGRTGNLVHVAGTTATSAEGKVVGVGDAYAQTRHALLTIERALAEAGAGLRHVVRTRMFVTDISLWEEIGRAHGEFFRDIRPANTIMQVASFIDPEWLVEIEADAVVDVAGDAV